MFSMAAQESRRGRVLVVLGIGVAIGPVLGQGASRPIDPGADAAVYDLLDTLDTLDDMEFLGRQDVSVVEPLDQMAPPHPPDERERFRRTDRRRGGIARRDLREDPERGRDRKGRIDGVARRHAERRRDRVRRRSRAHERGRTPREEASTWADPLQLRREVLDDREEWPVGSSRSRWVPGR